MKRYVTAESLSSGAFGEVTTFGSEETIRYDPGRATFHEFEGKFVEEFFKKGIVLRRPFYSILSQAEIVGDAGTIVSKQGSIILDSTLGTLHYFQRSWSSPAAAFRKFLSFEYFPGYTLSLVSRLSTNFLHWTSECLPRLLCFDHLPEQIRSSLKVLVDKGCDFQQESILTLFHLRADQIIEKPSSRLVCEKLIVPNCRHLRDGRTENYDLYSFECFSILRAKIAGNIPVSPRARQVLLIRRNSVARSLKNSDALRKVLPRLELIYPEDLTFSEKIAVFSDASLVVSVHGAAFGNFLFCQPGTKVIELFPRDWYWYHLLCTVPITQGNGLDHHIIGVKTRKVGTGPFDDELVLSHANIDLIVSLASS